MDRKEDQDEVLCNFKILRLKRGEELVKERQKEIGEWSSLEVKESFKLERGCG